MIKIANFFPPLTNALGHGVDIFRFIFIQFFLFILLLYLNYTRFYSLKLFKTKTRIKKKQKKNNETLQFIIVMV